MPSAELVAEVHQLLAAYGHAIDRCEAVAWAELFHPAGTSIGPGRPTLSGREELAGWVVKHPRPDLMHTCTNIWVESDGGDADPINVTSHFVIHQRAEDGSYTVLTAGSYADVVVRHQGRLVFKRRQAVPLSPPLPSLAPTP